MKNPSSKGDGTTGAWKSFSEAFNKMGKDTADKRRKTYDQLKKENKGFKKK